MRGGTRAGRFDLAQEMTMSYEAMEDELSTFTGSELLWYVFNLAETEVDPVYDTGGGADGGRHWDGPIPLKCWGSGCARARPSSPTAATTPPTRCTWWCPATWRAT